MKNAFPETAALDEAIVSPVKAGPRRIYRAGTLRYTLRGLLVLSLWLLGGDFAFTFFESIFGRFLPLYLKDLHASNSLIGLMTGSIAGVANLFFLPNVSQWSDRHRSRFGRRIPFLCVVAPLTVGALVAIGFAPELAGWLHLHLLAALFPTLSAGTVVLGFLCVMVVVYHFFNMILVNAYNWLLRDVVPQEAMARFLAWFRIISTASSFAFLWFVFPHLIAHRREIFVGIGVLYLAAFLLMCLNVKEGAYPPPPARELGRGFFASFTGYFREGLVIPLYRNFFLAYVLFVAATTCAAPFGVLFTREALGLDMGTMGRVLAWGAAASTLIYFPMAKLCDRFNPLSVALGSMIGFAVVSMLSFFLIRTAGSLLIYTVVGAIPAVGWGLGTMAATMRLFPEEKFGQFSSGMNVFSYGVIILGNYLIGKFIDLAHDNYRMTYLWSAALFALAVYPLLLVYRDWKKRGGAHGYIPPLPPEPAASR